MNEGMLPFLYPLAYFNPFMEQNAYPFLGRNHLQQNVGLNINQPVVKLQQSLDQEKTKQKSDVTPNKIKIQKKQLIQQSYKVTKRLWSQEEDKLLINSVDQQGLCWKEISKLMIFRNPKMCYNRYKRLCKRKKNLWSNEEDHKLKHLVESRKLKWKVLEKYFQNRKAKQLRERYLNFLRPNLSRQPWTVQEDLSLIKCINEMGKKWKEIQKILTQRSENQIKNRYYGRIQYIIQKKSKGQVKLEQNS